MKAPITNGTTKAAVSGPSASPAHGDGAGSESQSGAKGNSFSQPTTKDTPTLANHTGAEPLGKTTDHPNQ
jgi:hypothetical protein